jgi:hypothetical protein
MEFVQAYTQVLTQAWTDPSYLAELTANPKQVLTELGLDTGSASIQVVTTTEGDGDLGEQVQLFEDGLKTGEVKLYVPATPPLSAAEARMVNLDSEGDNIGPVAATPCCCCCPCCTCT